MTNKKYIAKLEQSAILAEFLDKNPQYTANFIGWVFKRISVKDMQEFIETCKAGVFA